ncbi:MAG: glycosyltransferase family 61 protein, partial [Cyanobacteria bacterium]|nr:glycosyltransferase family 61 protein [Cyanobacteriota bacterium]
LGIQEEQMLTLDKNSCIQAENLLYPSFVNFPGEPQLESIHWVRGLFDLPPQGALRLYISRKNAKSRHLVNELELEKLLARYQFQTVILEEMSVEEQASLFAQAACVIGQYGSGLSNLIFSHPGTEVIELVPPKMVSLRYRKIAHVLGLNYQPLKTLQESQSGLNAQIDSTAHVPLSLLEAMLDELFFSEVSINLEAKMMDPQTMESSCDKPFEEFSNQLDKSREIPASEGGNTNQKSTSKTKIRNIEKNIK